MVARARAVVGTVAALGCGLIFAGLVGCGGDQGQVQAAGGTEGVGVIGAVEGLGDLEGVTSGGWQVISFDDAADVDVGAGAGADADAGELPRAALPRLRSAISAAVMNARPWAHFATAQSLPESKHPYLANSRQVWRIETSPCVAALRVGFEKVGLEAEYDYVVVRDASGRFVDYVTGEHDYTVTAPAVGHTVMLQLLSDGLNEGYGFRVGHVEVAYHRECRVGSNAEDGAGGAPGDGPDTDTTKTLLGGVPRAPWGLDNRRNQEHWAAAGLAEDGGGASAAAGDDAVALTAPTPGVPVPAVPRFPPMGVAAEECFCTQEWRPVCSWSGETYGNACKARCAGATVAYPGPCDAQDDAPDCEETSCPPGQHCEIVSQACRYGGGCPAGPKCIADSGLGGPTIACNCGAHDAPVCGDDGMTYSNACLADCELAEVVHTGRCGVTGDGCGTALGLVCTTGYRCQYAGGGFVAPAPDAPGVCVAEGTCQQAMDCEGLTHPACVGRWVCAQRSCVYHCDPSVMVGGGLSEF